MNEAALVVAAGCCAFVVSLLLTPHVRNAAIRLKWVDQPDSFRKLHNAPVPRIGGVPVVLACIVSWAVFLVAGTLTGFSSGLSLALKLLPPSLIVLAAGIADDLIGLRPLHKLLGQCLAAALVSMSAFELDAFGIVVATFWIVGCSNAFNLIDGVDGLAAGLGSIATLTTLAAALWWSDVSLGLVAAAMAGALLGFLRFNFNPATIFLGDSGSLWMGFMLGCLGLVWFRNSSTVPSMIAPVILLAVPLSDTLLSIARRFVSDRPIFSADHDHIHHRLLSRFRTPSRVAIHFYGLGAMASVLALALTWASDPAGYAIAAVFCVATGMAVRRLGYLEFRVFAQSIHRVRSGVKYRLALINYERRLVRATSPEAYWFLLVGICREFGFSSATLRLAGRIYKQQLASIAENGWVLRIPLSPADVLTLTRPCDSSVGADSIALLADVLYRTLSNRAVAFRGAAEHPIKIAAIPS
jgi:UDP-GlcNAc:undecaprenyl-phosphate GlcNAc-1-phosphate transferase